MKTKTTDWPVMTNSLSLLIAEDDLFEWINSAQSSSRKKKRALAVKWLNDHGVLYRIGHKGVICVTALDLTASKIVETEVSPIEFG